MSKPTGFKEWPRRDPDKRAKVERLGDAREFTLPLAPEHRLQQAGRCMDCGVPFCHQGCPLGNPIPEFNAHVYRGRWREAFLALDSTNNFPEFTGRLCPAPCEAACVLAINARAVTIESIEKEIIERAFAEGWVTPRLPSHRTGKRVAVVGSGPAGLAAAAQLNQAGHSVTVFERDAKPGGLLRWGIPDFKLEKQIIDRRLSILEQEGVHFECGIDVGGARRWDALAAEHDALIVAIGAGRPRELDVPGRQLAGVLQAMDFLGDQNHAIAGSASALRFDARGKRVIILGGGDTGSDCLGTALRQGAHEVIQVELLEAPSAERATDNPWPQWPLVFRTSSSQEEGGARRFARLTTHLEGSAGTLQALHAVQVRLEPGDAGRVIPVAVPGTEERWPVDMLILAMGFTGPQTRTLHDQLGVALDARGNIATDATLCTSIPGVFCAGDAHRGASLIVWAISEGREVARAVDRHLTTRPSQLPTRGRDLSFGGR